MKLVGYTQRVEKEASYGERRDCADQRIWRFIKACGYLPMPLPGDCDIAEELVVRCSASGIILTGGNSLVKYGGDAPERDLLDKRMIEVSMRKNIPLYGFCRGMQSILDYFGCRLTDVQGHVAVRHPVNFTEGGREVNSYHRQGCRELAGEELMAEAKTDDGVIEMVRHRRYSILGTMWHPERENGFSEADLRMVMGFMGEG